MARGQPAIVSLLISVPFLVGGGIIYIRETQFAPEAGLPIALFGLFVFLVGLYIQLVAAPEGPRLDKDEEIVEKRHPSQRVAIARILIGLPFIFVSGYLLFFTYLPYVYPTVACLIGGAFLLTGLTRYWKNTLTGYWLTTERLIKEYRFLGLNRSYVPLSDVQGLSENKSPLQSMLSVGQITVATAGSGAGGTTKIIVRTIPGAERFAREIRTVRVSDSEPA